MRQIHDREHVDGSDKLRVVHSALKHGRNLLVIGHHGVGKTMAIRHIAEGMGNVIVRYLSLAQIDSGDLLVPFPTEEDGRGWVEYRPHKMFLDRDEHGVRKPILLIMDEFNRARDPSVYNALLEFMSVGTISGIQLNIHCFVGLMNPVEQNIYFNAAELERTVLDRFDVWVTVDQYDLGADVYLASRYEEAGAIMEWYLGLPDDLKLEVPPRRQEKIIQNWRLGIPPRYSLPPDTRVPVTQLENLLRGGTAWTLPKLLADPEAAAQAVRDRPALLPMFLSFMKIVRDYADARRLVPVVMSFPSHVIYGLIFYNPTLWGVVLRDYARQHTNRQMLEQIERSLQDVQENRATDSNLPNDSQHTGAQA